jgi:hypothetical protein
MSLPVEHAQETIQTNGSHIRQCGVTGEALDSTVRAEQAAKLIGWMRVQAVV